MIDLVRWMAGSDGARVWATANRGKLDALGVPTLDSVQLKVQFQNGVNFALDTSWVLPQSFEAVVNQGIRIVGSEGVIEVDSQDRGSRTCTAAEGTASQNLGFFLEETDKAGHPRWSGYGIESIVDFAENVSFLLDGGVLADLKGIFADGADGLEVTRIAEAAQRSLDTGLLVEIESTQSAGW
jgi:predicted dehydrogenase